MKWNSDRPRQAFQLALLGHTDKEIARVMGVDVNTIDYWKRTKPEFLKRLNEGKDSADAEIAEAFYLKAHGGFIEETQYTVYKGEVISFPVRKYYPPDSWAAHKWLTIRQRERWADVQRIETTQTNINITKIDLSVFSTKELELINKIGILQLTENASGN